MELHFNLAHSSRGSARRMARWHRGKSQCSGVASQSDRQKSLGQRQFFWSWWCPGWTQVTKNLFQQCKHARSKLRSRTFKKGLEHYGKYTRRFFAMCNSIVDIVVMYCIVTWYIIFLCGVFALRSGLWPMSSRFIFTIYDYCLIFRQRMYARRSPIQFKSPSSILVSV